MRDHFDGIGVSRYLDTPAGKALLGLHGYDRSRAAAALAQQEQADRDWRRARAEEKFERYPERYESPSHAMRDVPDPVTGGIWLGGPDATADSVATVLSGGDLRWRWHVGPAPQDDTVKVGTQDVYGNFVEDPSLTADPWNREGRQ